MLQKPKLRSRIIRSMNPKTISLEANNGMGVKKNSLGPQKTFKNGLFELQKMRKMIFFKKPELWDLTEHWGWFSQWPLLPGQCRTSWFNSLNPNHALPPCVFLIDRKIHKLPSSHHRNLYLSYIGETKIKL